MPQLHLDDLAARAEALPAFARLTAVAGSSHAYLVGGVVRDLLLGAARVDIDVVVEGDAVALARALDPRARVHDRFGTATARVDGVEVDVVRARRETYAKPGALPEVVPSDLDDDLRRRDFTINAMALRVSRPDAVIDPLGGLEDLRIGVLRVLHERSFADDPTRALRAARYAARLDLDLEPETAELLGAADLETVSTDRRDAELRAIAAEPQATRALTLLGEWGLLEIDTAALAAVEAVVAMRSAEPWAGTADGTEAVLLALRGGLAAARELATARPERPSAGVEMAHGRPASELLLARAMGAAWLDDYVTRWRAVRPAITGHDLLEAGIEPGPAVGRGLRAALRARLDGEVTGREEELRVALEAARAS